MLRLIGSLNRHPYVVGLFLGHFGQDGAQFVEMQPGHLLIQFFVEGIDTDLAGTPVLPEIDLRQNLIGKAVGHHKTGMAGGAAEIDQPPFGQQVDGMTVGKGVFIHLGFDLRPFLFRASR
jgi:hypothetical protein